MRNQADPPRSSGPAANQWAMPETSALRQLRSQVGDSAAVDRFVGDFLGLMSTRLDRLTALVGDQRAEAAETLLLSLETSADMIGADELAQAAHQVRAQLSPTQPAAALTTAMRRLREAAARLMVAAQPRSGRAKLHPHTDAGGVN